MADWRSTPSPNSEPTASWYWRPKRWLRLTYPWSLIVLAESRVREVHMVGRRGPVQAAFTPPEIKEFGVLADCDPIVSAAQLELGENSTEAGFARFLALQEAVRVAEQDAIGLGED